MADGVAVKINVADREYPMRVSAEEYDRVLEIEAEIKASINEFKVNYGVTDKQDLLAMLLVQSMMSPSNNNDPAEFENLQSKLQELESFVSNYLKS